MEYCDITDREFKMTAMKKLMSYKKIQRQFNELRNKINKQMEYFTKEIETLKKNQIEIMELKYLINDTKKHWKVLEIEQTICKKELVSWKIEIQK